MQPEIASKFFNQKWIKPITGYRIIKSMCKIKCTGIKKMFKELSVFLCENDVTKATNYLITALTAYEATTEIIFDRLVNVTIVCQIDNQAFVKIKGIFLESSSNLHTY